MEMKWEKLKWKYCYAKHKKNPETDGYERDRSLRSRKLKSNEIAITETRKKLKRKKTSASLDILPVLNEAAEIHVSPRNGWVRIQNSVSQKYNSCAKLCGIPVNFI